MQNRRGRLWVTVAWYLRALIEIKATVRLPVRRSTIFPLIPSCKVAPEDALLLARVRTGVAVLGPKLVQGLWNPKVLYITENGCAADDELADDGNVYDTDRIMFLRNYLTQLQRATADGVPVKGYFQSSTMDNFEWIYGYGNRFGLVYVDFKTQKRTPQAQRGMVSRDGTPKPSDVTRQCSIWVLPGAAFGASANVLAVDGSIHRTLSGFELSPFAGVIRNRNAWPTSLLQKSQDSD
jgi:Glycosyl hydrolase family 1